MLQSETAISAGTNGQTCAANIQWTSGHDHLFDRNRLSGFFLLPLQDAYQYKDNRDYSRDSDPENPPMESADLQLIEVLSEGMDLSDTQLRNTGIYLL
jgi:hypothetical protein